MKCVGDHNTSTFKKINATPASCANCTATLPIYLPRSFLPFPFLTCCVILPTSFWCKESHLRQRLVPNLEVRNPRLPKSLSMQLVIYADICIYDKSICPRFAHRAIQNHFYELGKRSTKWRMNKNTIKSSVIAFSKRKFLDFPNLKLCNADIAYVQECHYPGVILECRLNWKTHCELMRAKSFSFLSKSIPLLKSALPQKTKLLIYKA